MAVDPALRQKIVETYPAFAWLLDMPEVGDLLATASAEGWDITRLQAQLYATNWWRTWSQTQRNWSTLAATDPAEAQRQRVIKQDEVAAEIRRMGAILTYDEVLWVTEMALANGSSAQQISATISQISRQHGVTEQGTIRRDWREIESMAKQYAFTLGHGSALDWAYNVAGGSMTMDGVKAQMVETARSKYANNSSILNGLERGLTVWDIMQPVLGRVSQELGVGVDTIDLTEGMGSQLVNYIDPKTGELRIMTDTEAIQFSRSQESWKTTANGRALAAQLADGITQRMGRR